MENNTLTTENLSLAETLAPIIAENEREAPLRALHLAMATTEPDQAPTTGSGQTARLDGFFVSFDGRAPGPWTTANDLALLNAAAHQSRRSTF